MALRFLSSTLSNVDNTTEGESYWRHEGSRGVDILCFFSNTGLLLVKHHVLSLTQGTMNLGVWDAEIGFGELRATSGLPLKDVDTHLYIAYFLTVAPSFASLHFE